MINDSEDCGRSGHAQECLRIELGPGANAQVADALTIDLSFAAAPDVRADLECGLAFLADQSVDEIHSHHVLEHIENFESLLEECFRILRPGGVFIGSVPHFSNPYLYSDPTHRRTFGLYTFGYYCEGSELQREVPRYRQTGFRCRELRIKFLSPFHRRNWFKRWIERMVNLNSWTMEMYEENLCYFAPAYELWFALEKPR